MFGITPLRPIYGRTYHNKQQVQDDLNAGEDFITSIGQYINKAQLIELNLSNVEIRYGIHGEKCYVANLT